MRKKLIIIFLFLIFPFFVSAYTKEDVIKLVDNQHVCDQESEALYKRYFNMYTRLLKSKDVSEENLGIIYQNMSSVLKIVKEENICSYDDLDRVSSKTKNQIYNYLYDTSKLIIKSPDLENSETTIKYGEDNTIEIYEDGEYLDRVTLTKTTFNYVGFSSMFVYLKYILPALLFIIFIALIRTKNKKLLNNLLIIIFTFIFIINILYFKFGSFFYDSYNIVKSMNYIENKDIVKMKVKNKKLTRYPTYGSEYARLIIKSVDINLPVLYGDSKEVLKNGIGFTGAFPGFRGTTILSGHNSKTYLNSIKNIKFDDTIIVKTNYGEFEYKVSKMEVLDVNQYNDLIKDDKTLILYTCYPFDKIVYSNQRFVVYASLEKEVWSND